MYGLMDMGTSNTRLWLCDGERVLFGTKASFGAKYGKMEGREALYGRLRALIGDGLERCGVSAEQVEYLTVSGMAGSEMGICEIPHVPLPIDLRGLAASVTVKKIPEITEIPLVFVPGVKQLRDGRLDDMMRGEETELFGILPALPRGEERVIILPGTHCKILRIGREGDLLEFYTTFSGELLSLILTESILKGQVGHDFVLLAEEARRGMVYGRERGLNAALFHVRVMGMGGASYDACSSFLYGAVLGQDISLICSVANGCRIYVGGREGLRRAYGALLEGESVCELSDEVSERAMRNGLMEVRSYFSFKKEK